VYGAREQQENPFEERKIPEKEAKAHAMGTGAKRGKKSV
jgi:hypothetical protein